MKLNEAEHHSAGAPGRAATPAFDPETHIQMSALAEQSRQGQAAEWMASIDPSANSSADPTADPTAHPGADPHSAADLHSAAHVQDTALAGTAGPAAPLPHAETIQQAFGRHDISGIHAHLDAPARNASRAIGAQAYATGEDIAFAAPPDLHTAAHEAAHVVQQRAGVSLKTNLSRPGDPYEQHADAVADAVVAGRNAEDLLSAHAPAALSSDPSSDATSAPNRTRRADTIQRTPAEATLNYTPHDAPSPFATAFNREFTSILHAFAPGAGGAGDAIASDPEQMTPTQSGTQPPQGRSGTDLDDHRLAQLFTGTQPTKLHHYATTHEIPERLFNGDELGGTTAQQRILIASHILAHGHYRPTSLEQRVHARMCFHWAHLVHHYAGVTPQSGALTDGVMGTTDHTGQIVLGGGDRSTGRQGGRTEAPGRKEARQQRLEAAQQALDEAIASGTAKPERLRQLQLAVKSAEAAAGRDYIRNAALPLADIRGLQPGDWIYYHNDNDSRSGDHSVIFSRWLTEERTAPGQGTDPVHYWQAEVFSQGLPETGGRQHTAWLGTGIAQVDGITINPVTRFSRVPQDSRPATTVDELLPLPHTLRTPPPPGATPRQIETYERRLAQYTTGIQTQNAAHLRRQLRGQTYDETQAFAAIARWIRTQNTALISALAKRTTPGQRALLTEANAPKQTLETAIRLNERLRALQTNVEVTARGATTETDRFEARYQTGITQWRTAVQKALEPLDTRLANAATALTEADPDLPATATETRALIDSEAIPDLRQAIAHLRQSDPTSTPETEADQLTAIDTALTHLLPRITPTRRELIRARPRPPTLRAADAPLNLLLARIRIYQPAIREANKQTPYVMAHGGSTHGGVANETTGLLANVPAIPWTALIRPTPTSGGGAPPS